MRVWVFLFSIILFSDRCVAQDYEREKRWAAEIVPNLVVGDAVQLKLPSGREFLGIYAESKAAKNAIKRPAPPASAPVRPKAPSQAF